MTTIFFCVLAIFIVWAVMFGFVLPITARMILGIGCELIIRAAYLNKGFIINKFLEKKSLPPKIKERNFPSKFKDFKHLRNGIYPYLKNKTYSTKVCDAQGSISTPAGYYEDVLRLKTKDIKIDKLSNQN